MRKLRFKIADLLVYFLRKLKVTVMIGINVKDRIHCKYDQTLLYDCSWDDPQIITSDGNVFEIPLNQPFNVNTPRNEKN